MWGKLGEWENYVLPTIFVALLWFCCGSLFLFIDMYCGLEILTFWISYSYFHNLVTVFDNFALHTYVKLQQFICKTHFTIFHVFATKIIWFVVLYFLFSIIFCHENIIF